MDGPALNARTGFTRHPRFLALLFSLPFIYGSFRQLWRHTAWFDDFEAVSCAGQALNAKLPLYTLKFNCANAAPTAYVYPPASARFFAMLQMHYGVTFTIVAYAAVFLFVVYNVLRLLIAPDGKASTRAPFLAELPGSALPSGNISIVLHGLIFLCGRWFAGRPVLLVPVVAAAAIVKPTFVVYLALFLFIKRPAPERALLMLISGLMIGGYFVVFYITDRTDFINWQKLAHFFGLVAERGNGIFGIVDVSNPVVLAACYGLFACLILCSGLFLAEFCVEDATDRLMLGVSICVLLYPRPLGYDLFTLPFGLGVVVGCFQRAGAFQARHLAMILWVVCPVLVVIGGRAGERMFFVLYCGLVFFLSGAAVLMRVRAGIKQCFMGPIVIGGRRDLASAMDAGSRPA